MYDGETLPELKMEDSEAVTEPWGKRSDSETWFVCMVETCKEGTEVSDNWVELVEITLRFGMEEVGVIVLVDTLLVTISEDNAVSPPVYRELADSEMPERVAEEEEKKYEETESVKPDEEDISPDVVSDSWELLGISPVEDVRAGYDDGFSDADVTTLDGTDSEAELELNSKLEEEEEEDAEDTSDTDVEMPDDSDATADESSIEEVNTSEDEACEALAGTFT